MKRYPTQREKTLRAFRVYVEVMDTAAWMRSWMKGPLQTFDLTPQGFRLLILLCENGPMRMMEISRQMRFQRQNLDVIVRRLEERGWIRRALVDLPAETGERKGSRTRGMGTPKRRWGVGVIALTPEGEGFVARVFPNHAKVVKALTRALHGREQQTLVEICRKLRAGAILKFMSEIAHPDEWEMAAQPIVGESHGAADEARRSLLRPPAEDDDASEDDEGLEGDDALEDGTEETISEADRARLPGIVAKMRRYTILKDAKNVDWNKPFDEKRWAGTVVEMLMRVGSDTERKMIAQWRQRMNSEEIVKMLKEEMGEEES